MVMSRGIISAHVVWPKNVERVQVNECGIAVNNDSGILKPEECNEKTDARCNCSLDSFRYCVKDKPAEACDREQKKHDAVHKNHDERICIGKAHADANRVNKECIQTHAGCLCKRQVGKQADEQRSEHCGDCGCDINGVIITCAECVASERGEHSCVDHQNVRHRHKGRDARNQFGANCGVVLFELKHVSSSNSKLCSLFNAESQPHTIADIQPLNRRILLYQKLLG